MLFILLISSLLTVLERKVLSICHRRIGPSYNGWYGLMQIISDGIKLIIYNNINKNIFNIKFILKRLKDLFIIINNIITMYILRRFGPTKIINGFISIYILVLPLGILLFINVLQLVFVELLKILMKILIVNILGISLYNIYDTYNMLINVFEELLEMLL